MLLLNEFDGLPQEIVSNMLKNKNKNATNRRYSKIINEFALTLYFYSPKVYEYARYEFAFTHASALHLTYQIVYYYLLLFFLVLF